MTSGEAFDKMLFLFAKANQLDRKDLSKSEESQLILKEFNDLWPKINEFDKKILIQISNLCSQSKDNELRIKALNELIL